jgi:hypothetical protein
MDIDWQKLNDLLKEPRLRGGSNELQRSDSVFFVGGELPVYETLQTMYESFCMESTELFHLSFGPMGTLQSGEEMARQIKKNFRVRLMGCLNYPAAVNSLERIYAAGVDILDIPLLSFDCPSTGTYEALLSALPIFPRWSVASTLLAGGESAISTMNGIDLLLKNGVVPLVAFGREGTDASPETIAEIFQHLALGWQRCDVSIQPFLPMITSLTPLVPRDTSGLLRGLLDKFHNQRLLVASDLRRHLRVLRPEDSMDSAAL